MGLLLSILVTCVGVVELLAFYRNVKRRVNYQPTQTSLKEIHERNYKELEGVRDRLANQLEQLSEETQGIQKSKAQECLPEYLILKDGDAPVALPQPEAFVVSEHDVFRKKLGHTEVEVEGELYFRRSPSPFPTFKITSPRNSVCSELLDDAASVAEVDEVDIILDASASSHKSAQYWDNKALVVNAKKSKSRTPSPKPRHVEPIQKTSSKDDSNNDDDDEEEFVEVEPYTEEMKNCLDGVDNKKGCVKKKYVKRKRTKKTNNLGTNRFK